MEFFNIDGTDAEPLEAIAPILSSTPRGWQILGTGFFVTSTGTMFTAKHLLANLPAEGDLVVFHKEFKRPTHVLRRVVGVINHPLADVALLFLEPAESETTKERVRCAILRVSADVPSINSRVGCWGYPKSWLLPPDHQFDGYTVLLERKGAQGAIEEHFPSGLDRIMHPGECFQTSMNTLGGSSGGPVFNEHGEVFAVVSSGIDEHTTFVAPVRDLALAKLIPIDGGETMISLVEYVQKY